MINTSVNLTECRLQRNSSIQQKGHQVSYPRRIRARDYTRYDVFDPEGNKLSTDKPKGRIALKIIQHFALQKTKEYRKKNVDLTYHMLKDFFPDMLQNANAIIWEGPLVITLQEAIRINDEEPNKKYYVNEKELIEVNHQGEKIAVVITNQWGINNIGDFIEHAQSMGYVIEEN